MIYHDLAVVSYFKNHSLLTVLEYALGILVPHVCQPAACIEKLQ